MSVACSSTPEPLASSLTPESAWMAERVETARVTVWS